MASGTFFRMGPRSGRLEYETVNEEGTNATYHMSGLAYVETYDDVEYVTSAGLYLRQDDATECKRARDAYQANERSIRLAAEELAESKDKEATPVTTTD